MTEGALGQRCAYLSANVCSISAKPVIFGVYVPQIMKKDISFTPVTGIYVTIARRINELNQPEWNVYLINRNPTLITNVFVTSRGYSGDDIKKKEVTSKNTYYFKNMKDAINSYIDKKLKEKETVSEAIEELKILLNRNYEIRN